MTTRREFMKAAVGAVLLGAAGVGRPAWPEGVWLIGENGERIAQVIDFKLTSMPVVLPEAYHEFNRLYPSVGSIRSLYMDGYKIESPVLISVSFTQAVEG